MTLLQKKRHRERHRGRRTYRRGQTLRKRRRTRLLVLVGLSAVLLLIFASYYGGDALLNVMVRSETEDAGVEQVEEPTVAEAPEAISEPTSQKPTEEEDETSEDIPVPPEDPTMYLSIPKLGVSGALVADGETGLELGAEHLPGTGFPWLLGSNTYIAGHRLGFPGTGSDHIFFGLPSLAPGDEAILTDTNGQVYRYRVSEILQVDPTDLSVVAPVGRDVLSLQTCIEDFGDFATLGPGWNIRLIVRADRVA